MLLFWGRFNKRLRVGLLLIPSRALRFVLPDQLPVLACADPTIDRDNEQQQSQNAERHQPSTPAQPEKPRILVGLTREIDIDAHL